MSANSIRKRSTRYAAAVAAGIAMYSLLSPASANTRQNIGRVFPDLKVSAAAKNGEQGLAMAVPARNRAIGPTSHLPWLAPIGHRQPQRDEAPQSDATSAWEREQAHFNEALDHRLVICRGC
jgi:hypothetical protein